MKILIHAEIDLGSKILVRDFEEKKWIKATINGWTNPVLRGEKLESKVLIKCEDQMEYWEKPLGDKYLCNYADLILLRDIPRV